MRLRRYLRRRFTAAGVNDGAPPRRCHAARHRAPCAAAGGGGRDGHAGRSGGPSAALAISPVWDWRRFAFRRRGGPPRRPHHGSSRAARRLEAGIPGRPTVRAQRRPSLTRRPTTRRLALAPSLPAPTVVHAKTAAAGRGPPRLGPSAPPWGRPLPHGAVGRCTPTTAIHSRRASRWGGGNAPAGPRGTAVAHFASPTRFIHQAPHTVWATGRAHRGVRAQETVGAPRAPAPPTAQRHRPAPSSAPLAACTLHRRKKKTKRIVTMSLLKEVVVASQPCTQSRCQSQPHFHPRPCLSHTDRAH